MDVVESMLEVVVRGRNVVVPEHYRQHVTEKLLRMERYDHKIFRADVELQHERNPRQHGSCQHVEITCRTRGPLVRAQGCAEDFSTALDLAMEKLERRFRQAADRRREHHARRVSRPASAPAAPSADRAEPSAPEGASEVPDSDDGPGRVVREKDHAAEPMTVDQALLAMELVGHDFYLFADAQTQVPSVVYRRHAYDYGLIRLVALPDQADRSAPEPAGRTASRR